MSALKPRITEETLRAIAVIANLGEATPTQVCARTGLASGTVSPMLARLEAAGWLARRDEAGEAKALGRPLRAFYRIGDETQVRQSIASLRELVAQLAEDLEIPVAALGDSDA